MKVSSDFSGGSVGDFQPGDIVQHADGSIGVVGNKKDVFWLSDLNPNTDPNPFHEEDITKAGVFRLPTGTRITLVQE